MNTCFEVANYFLSMQDEEAGDSITNLKLQKLLYYAQGFHLAILDKPIFPDTIEAWEHGPVVPAVYHQFKIYGAKGIPPPESFDFAVFEKDSLAVLNEVYNALGQFSAWKLRSMTHNEPPWQDARNSNSFISPESMKAYFSTQITDDEENQKSTAV